MTGGHVPTKGKGKPTSPPNEGSGGFKGHWSDTEPLGKMEIVQNCGICRFFGNQSFNDIENGRLMQNFGPCCRLHAPRVFEDSVVGNQTLFPTTWDGGWCGEYEYQPAKPHTMTVRVDPGHEEFTAPTKSNCHSSPHGKHTFSPTGQCKYCGKMAEGFDDTFTAADAKPPEPILENASCVDGLPDVCKSGVHEYLEGGGATSCIFCGHVPED